VPALPPVEVASLRSGPKYKIEACSFCERSQVPVSREERNAPVNAALGDQGVDETRLATLCEDSFCRVWLCLYLLYLRLSCTRAGDVIQLLHEESHRTIARATGSGH
jgi:hypothetical protein